MGKMKTYKVGVKLKSGRETVRTVKAQSKDIARAKTMRDRKVDWVTYVMVE